ncbi:MAG: adenine phosphoribosyltransferase [Bacteroidetes bacterium]|nr:adenine phosphoribosyltransferase [Bacteroidota bacterium]
MKSLSDQILSTVREVPDFPKKGINFKDITPILENPKLCREIVDEFISRFSKTKIDAIVGIESRGFLFGMTLAMRLNIPFITVRKKGKLPYKTVSYRYELEYGSAEMEMHVDTVKPGWKVLIHDDLLATGGTAAAAAELVKMQKGKIAGFAFLVELSFLDGIKKINGYSDKIVALVRY